MRETTALSMGLRKKRLASFTLVELLTVMAIISILASLMIFAATSMWTKAKRSRAASEIQGMSAALESYKTDNGIYPEASSLLTNTYTANDGKQSGGQYQASSRLLYKALSSKVSFSDFTLSTASPATGKAYMSFKQNQIGDPTGAITGGSYVQDPWGYSYGYSTGDANNPQQISPYSGRGFFDLWSTGGLTVPANTNINTWISN